MKNKNYQRRLWKEYGERIGPYYSEKYDTWMLPAKMVNGSLFMDEGDIHYIFSEYCWTGLSFHFYIDGERDHEHRFQDVLAAAYENYDSFEIREEDKEEYSLQELLFLEKLLNKRKSDLGGEDL